MMMVSESTFSYDYITFVSWCSSSNSYYLLLLLFPVVVEDCTVSLFGANTISEDSSFISICVQLDGPTTGDVLVNYNTFSLTATGRLTS